MIIHIHTLCIYIYRYCVYIYIYIHTSHKSHDTSMAIVTGHDTLELYMICLTPIANVVYRYKVIQNC